MALNHHESYHYCAYHICFVKCLSKFKSYFANLDFLKFTVNFLIKSNQNIELLWINYFIHHNHMLNLLFSIVECFVFGLFLSKLLILWLHWSDDYSHFLNDHSRFNNPDQIFIFFGHIIYHKYLFGKQSRNLLCLEFNRFWLS